MSTGLGCRQCFELARASSLSVRWSSLIDVSSSRTGDADAGV